VDRVTDAAHRGGGGLPVGLSRAVPRDDDTRSGSGFASYRHGDSNGRSAAHGFTIYAICVQSAAAG